MWWRLAGFASATSVLDFLHELAHGGDQSFNFNSGDTLIPVTFTSTGQPTVKVKVPGPNGADQQLPLVFDLSTADTVLFLGGPYKCAGVANPPDFCYSVNASTTAALCGEQFFCKNDHKFVCDPNSCLPPSKIETAPTFKHERRVDGTLFTESAVEGLESLELALQTSESTLRLSGKNSPVRLLKAFEAKPGPPLPLFTDTAGIFGAAGPSLACRSGTSVWGGVVSKLRIGTIVLDWHPTGDSFVRFAPQGDGLSWTAPKQTGDFLNDGLHSGLIYRPELCGVDLLYNESSNWLAVLATSGPCLTLPPVLYDRVIARTALICEGAGLCAVPETSRPLPALTFRLSEDVDQPPLSIALEGLIVKDSSKTDRLCLTKGLPVPNDAGPADMLQRPIRFGAMVLKQLYTVIDLKNGRLGFRNQGSFKSGTSACVADISCVGAQSYYPPLNVCLDPPCSDYAFVELDDETKTCRWVSWGPPLLASFLLAVAIADFVVHKLYRKAVSRARALAS